MPLLHRFLETNPNDPRALSNLGFAYYNLDQMDAAIDAYERADRAAYRIGAAVDRAGL